MNRRVKRIVNILDKKKAENIAVFDLTGSSYFVDFVVIATSMAQKHEIALLNELKEQLKPKGEEFLNVDESEGWIVIDLGDILVHIMNTEHREKFKLEEFLDKIIQDRQPPIKKAPKRSVKNRLILQNSTQE